MSSLLFHKLFRGYIYEYLLCWYIKSFSLRSNKSTFIYINQNSMQIIVQSLSKYEPIFYTFSVLKQKWLLAFFSRILNIVHMSTVLSCSFFNGIIWHICNNVYMSIYILYVHICVFVVEIYLNHLYWIKLSWLN